MAKKHNQPPLVTSVSSTIRKTIQDTQVVTPEEVKEKKKDVLGVIDQALELFKKNLVDGNVALNSSLDLERLVKLMLLVSGEADNITGKPHGEQEQDTTVTLQTAGLSASKIESILNLDDPDVQSMFDKLYYGYNQENDIEE